MPSVVDHLKRWAQIGFDWGMLDRAEPPKAGDQVVIFTHDEELLSELVEEYNNRRSYIGANRSDDLKDIMRTYAMQTLRRIAL